MHSDKTINLAYDKETSEPSAVARTSLDMRRGLYVVVHVSMDLATFKPIHSALELKGLINSQMGLSVKSLKNEAFFTRVEPSGSKFYEITFKAQQITRKKP